MIHISYLFTFTNNVVHMDFLWSLVALGQELFRGRSCPKTVSHCITTLNLQGEFIFDHKYVMKTRNILLTLIKMKHAYSTKSEHVCVYRLVQDCRFPCQNQHHVTRTTLWKVPQLACRTQLSDSILILGSFSFFPIRPQLLYVWCPISDFIFFLR